MCHFSGNWCSYYGTSEPSHNKDITGTKTCYEVQWSRKTDRYCQATYESYHKTFNAASVYWHLQLEAISQSLSTIPENLSYRKKWIKNTCYRCVNGSQVMLWICAQSAFIVGTASSSTGPDNWHHQPTILIISVSSNYSLSAETAPLWFVGPCDLISIIYAHCCNFVAPCPHSIRTKFHQNQT